MFVSVGSAKMPGGSFAQMGEAPSSFLRSDDTDLSDSVTIRPDEGNNTPFMDGFELELSPEALG